MTLVALGDSLLAGMGCHEENRRLSWKRCSYPQRLVEQLNATSCTAFRLINRAVGGTTTAGALPQLPLLVSLDDTHRAPDLVLIDYSLNDQSQPQV